MTLIDMDLVREYAQSESEEAFASLVSRHVNLVYSVALRHVGNSHLAEEITQTVFVVLARKAGSLHPNTIVSGWLCRTTRFVSTRAITAQNRRQHREQEAYMQSQLERHESDSLAWAQIEPLLDSAMGQLAGKDHDALVLRFLEGKNFRQVSTSLGTTEAGAKMRVNRAIEKLRAYFCKKGFVLSAAVIATAISTHSVQAAPIGLATSATVAAVKGTAATASALTLINTTLKLMAWTKLKSSLVIATVALIVGTTSVTIYKLNATPAKIIAAKSGFTFAGYATPEATLHSLLWAASTGDVEKLLACCTPDQVKRFKAKLAGKTEAEVAASLKQISTSMADFKLEKTEPISEDQARLHLTVQPFPGHPHVGHDIQVMQRIDSNWKYAGKYGVDFKED